MEDPTAIAQLILNLLFSSSPEFGARLKQRLNADLALQGLGPLHEKAYGYKRFTDFLQGVLGEKVSITRPTEAGDICVSLRTTQSAQRSWRAEALGGKNTQPAPVIRSEVWQAFTNPDAQRKRFFSKTTKSIGHYLQDETNPKKDEVAKDPERCLAIGPIDGQVQVDWMRGFLESIRIAPSERAPLEALLNEPYSSSVNAAFTRALGPNGGAWRQFRTHRVIGVIQEWAKQNGIPFEDLCVQTQVRLDQPAQGLDEATRFRPRQQAIRLLELIPEEDISTLVLPTLLSTILVKSRLSK